MKSLTAMVIAVALFAWGMLDVPLIKVLIFTALGWFYVWGLASWVEERTAPSPRPVWDMPLWDVLLRLRAFFFNFWLPRVVAIGVTVGGVGLILWALGVD